MPAGFEPASVTFVSPTEGFVLGTTVSCAQTPCTSVLRTTDAGAHWVGRPAPREAVRTPKAVGLTGIRFADPRDGVAYGTDGMWATHDGAASWHKLSIPNGIIDTVVAVDGVIFASDRGASDSTQLLRAAAASDSYTEVPGVVATGAFAVAAGDDVLFSGDVSTTVLNAAGHIIRVVHNPENNCGLGASSATDYLLSCGMIDIGDGMGSRAVFGTTDGGIHWDLLPTPRCAGYDGNNVAVTTDGHAIIVGASALGGELCVTTDAARTWSVRLMPPTHDDAEFGDVGFTTTTFGEAVFDPPTAATPGDIARPTLYLTRDGGETWTTAAF